MARKIKYTLLHNKDGEVHHDTEPAFVGVLVDGKIPHFLIQDAIYMDEKIFSAIDFAIEYGYEVAIFVNRNKITKILRVI